MPPRYALPVVLLLLVLLPPGLATPARAQQQVALTPTKDNTLYESPTGGLSNGAGPHFYVGRTNRGERRRALLAFDVAGQVPANAQILSVTLTLQASNERPGAGANTIGLHRVEADWGEGTSNAGSPGGAGTSASNDDATWLHRFFPSTLWTTPGGDFDDTPSALAAVDNPGTYAWTSTAMADDVRDWLERPEENFGWLLMGGEATNGSAKRFDSRESGNGPVLTITFSTATAVEDETTPAAYRLAQNYPNPFASGTTIAFTLPTGGPVHLTVYDLLGHEVETLVDGVRPAGTHTVVFDAGALPSGLYLYRLTAAGRTHTRTMTLLR